MLRSIRLTSLAIAVISVGSVAPVHAALVLHLDAALPGNDPVNTWKDLSGSGYNFGNNGATYNAGTQSYHFGGDDYLIGNGSASESIYDFETDKGGTGTPFSIVVYAKDTSGHDGNVTALSKRDTGGVGYTVQPKQYDNTRPNPRIDAIMNDWPDREFYRYSGTSSNQDYNLFIWTFDGTGTVAGTKLYINGSTTPVTVGYNEDSLNASILNNEHLIIGYDPGTDGGAAYYTGEIGIIEIWNEVLAPEYSELRWNGGDLVRAVPEPSSIAMSLWAGAVGVACLLRRRRRNSA